MTKYKCNKCGREYETPEIRFSGGSKLECVYCLGIKQGGEKPGQEKEEKPKEKMIEYLCTSCNYSFKRKRSADISRCPYCSKENTLTLKSSQSANKLLRESLDRKYDF